MHTDFTLNRYETLLLTALRSALWGNPEASNEFDTLTEEEWKNLHRVAIAQGVQAVAFDGLQRLTPPPSIPRPLKLQWAVSVEGIEKNYDYYCTVATKLSRFLEENHIAMMQLKGLGLAQLYPCPSHREGGDIDVYLFGKYKRANELMRENGISVDTSYSKHSTFYYDHIPVENHQTFLNVEMFRIDRILERYLRNYCDDEPEYFTVKDTKLRRPSPNFNALFLARHASAHFALGGIVLRHLCDWALFLTQHRDNIDFPALERVLTEVKLLPIVNAFTGVAIHWLGLDAACFPPYVSNRELEQFVLDILLHSPEVVEPKGANALTILAFKWQRFLASREKYETVYGKTFYHRLWQSVVEHVKHPDTILKLQ